jgi:transposase-like protein
MKARWPSFCSRATKSPLSWATIVEINITPEVHRHWPDEVKVQIVSESLCPGEMVNGVAERHGLKPIHLST